MRTPTIGSIVLIALLAGKTMWASQAEQPAPAGLRGPVIGYVLDAGMQAIRPINGIPGSSVLGEPLTLPFSVAAAAFSPRGDFALAISASGDQTAYLLRNLGSTNNTESIEGAINGADAVVFNIDGSAGALFASGVRQLQIVRGLPASPTVGPTVDLSSIPGTISALAIDQAGSNILIAVSADHGGLYLATDEQIRPRLIASFGSPSAITFFEGEQDVIVADAAVNELTLIRNFASAPEAFRLAGGRDGISGPAGLRISPDSRKLYIANGTSRTLDIWNFETKSIEASFALDAEPTRLTALQGSSTFVMNDVGDHPLLLLDAVNLGAYFVPAGRERN